MDEAGRIFPVVYLRRGGRLREEPLEPHPLNEFDCPDHLRGLSRLLAAA
jgi:hypothetical protein